MFSNNTRVKRRGRPRGETAQGVAAREHLYATAIGLIAERGYDATTLRDIAAKARVSVGLLYRYFPSKQAVVLALYERLSAEYAARAANLPAGKWGARFVFALDTSLDVLRPHRVTLRALIPVLVGHSDDGVFAPGTAFSRQRVLNVFEAAVAEATDAPAAALRTALPRLLYLAHLAVLMWWLLDTSPKERATSGLIALLKRMLPSLPLALRLPPLRRFVVDMDELIRDGLFADALRNE
jgi:AcrR family transcriptional regulator